MFHLNLVDLHNPRLDRVVLQGFPLKDLQSCCKLWLTLVAEQPAQITKKEPCKDCYPERTVFHNYVADIRQQVEMSRNKFNWETRGELRTLDDKWGKIRRFEENLLQMSRKSKYGGRTWLNFGHSSQPWQNEAKLGKLNLFKLCQTCSKVIIFSYASSSTVYPCQWVSKRVGRVFGLA